MIVNLTSWHSFIDKHPEAHLLQTGQWGELKGSFGWKPVRVISDGCGAQILFRQLQLGYSIGYIPKGPIQITNSSDQFWKEIEEICREEKAIFLKVEPDGWENESLPIFSKKPIVLSKHTIQPRRTIIVQLSEMDDEILARMKQKTRYNIRLAKKKGVAVRRWDDVKAFHEMMNLTGERDSFGVHSLFYFEKAYQLFRPSHMCELLVAEYENTPLAALMVFARNKRAWYFYGASSDEYRNLMPAYLLQWEAIRWAKSKACDTYDFWGIPDENEDVLETQFSERSDGLWGVYRFKRGFGGSIKKTAQASDIIYNPLLYKAYEHLAARQAGN